MTMAPKHTFGALLRNHCTAAHLTQAELSENGWPSVIGSEVWLCFRSQRRIR
jgi:hypothetical protein